MSEERKKRQGQRQKESEPQPLPWKKIGLAVGIIIVVGAGYYLVTKKSPGRLDSFAQCLSSKGVKMYGAFWCPHCEEQKELFGSSFDYAPYVECGIEGSRAEQKICIEAGIKNFPTWVFADGSKVEGKLQIVALQEKTGCPLP